MRKTHKINSGHPFPFLWTYPSALIARLAPGLIIDVGAATGDTAVLMRNANASSRLIAYEPFPGNLPMLERTVGSDPMITCRHVAVSDYQGSGTFTVPSITDGSDKQWAAYAGSSRVGTLNSRSSRKAAAKVDVPVVMLDAEISEHVSFLKIDVQGGEYNVLNGARKIIEHYGIDMIYTEFRGDMRLLRFLNKQGYVFFDGIYLAWPHRRNLQNLFRPKHDWRIPDWEILRAVTLSNGVRACIVWPRIPFRQFTLYCAWFYFQRIFVTGLQTDLLCVHERFLDEFRHICQIATSEIVNRSAEPNPG